MKFPTVRDVLVTFVGIVFFVALFFGYKKIEDIREFSKNTYNGLNYISSGMSLDEQRLRKVLQTERIIRHYNKNLKKEFVHSLAINIVDVSSRYPSIDHVLLCALIAVESGFNPVTVSRAGAKGLTQIMDGTAEEITWKLTWTYYDGITLDPEKNVIMGAFYLDRMISINKGNVEHALAYYNGGFRWGSAYKLNKTEKAGHYVPKETLEYPGKVLGTYERLNKTFKFEMKNG